MKYKVHPVAEMFPMMEEKSINFKHLMRSIDAVGQLEPIIVDGDTLIDGRHRLKACEALGVEPLIIEWASLDIKATQGEWIQAKNLERRHLTPDQKAQIAAVTERWLIEDNCKRRSGNSRFQPGSKGGPGRGKTSEKTVRTNPCEPDPERDHKKEHANSTVGQIAAKAGVSFHKARQAIAIANALQEGAIEQSDVDEVIAGKSKPSEVLKKVAAKKGKKPKKKDIFKALLRLWKQASESERVAFWKEVQ